MIGYLAHLIGVKNPYAFSLNIGVQALFCWSLFGCKIGHGKVFILLLPFLVSRLGFFLLDPAPGLC
jgi:hypothetical protein